MRNGIARRPHVAAYWPAQFAFPQQYQFVNGELVPAPRVLAGLGCASCSGRMGCANCRRRFRGLGDDSIPTDSSGSEAPADIPLYPVPQVPSNPVDWSGITSLINAGANVAGKLIASSRGISPQVFAAQNPQLMTASQAALVQQQYQALAARQNSFGSFFTQQWGPLPAWAWLGGAVGIAVLAKVVSK